ncbi:uncharacterized protein L201_003645 [Kwoniella dendrophila CBS 6074]|uniref:NAD(P)-binding domain-containing protein n=1 Tax=Kwoniella dendrophila CBS 6074 TaxID=1295534 RepID=A0AAX4JTQ2_9TREE
MSSINNKQAVFFGASKGIGYFTLLSILENNQDWNTTLLLRKPDCFNDNHLIKPFIDNGRVKIIKGDATNEVDIRKCFDNDNKRVDLVVSSIGAAPSFGLTGIKIDQPELCTKGTLGLLHVLQELKTPLPRLIIVSSMGIGQAHQDMPLDMRLMYSWLLEKPHEDKKSLEYLIHRSGSGLVEMTSTKDIPSKTILSDSQIQSVKQNFLNEVIIIRPAFMPTEEAFDAKPTQDKSKVRIEEGLKCYTIKRSDVGRFIQEDCISPNCKWVNKCPVIGY